MKKTQDSKFKNIIGPQVKAARLAFAPPLSQDALAGRLAKWGISLDRSAISRIESRERYVMDYEAVALAKCLKVSIGYLYQQE
ncbi:MULTISPECIES: helix-turn-helix transcriptional regulator [unclassified Microbulbifer]|uniref:helix-turn-helix domain-containing protein n=1 Tax=unclassified Microbulbifer TaxID=2619833 RepID=UPI0027E49716|nr:MULTISPECIES: helix-turn-helix transcriptional regulator [unclassified Microbulbifer]